MEEFSLGTLFIALVAILICSGFFSSSETSMMALNRHRLSHLVRKGNKSAKLTAKLLAQTDKLLGSILFGNTLLNTVAASLTGIIVLRLFGHDDWALLAGTLAITFIILVFSEIMPKVVAASYPERVALPSSYVLTPIIRLFHPVVSIATAMVRGFLWLLNIKVQVDRSHQKVSLEEVRMMVLEAENFLPHKHQKMLLNLVDLERIAVNDVMVPRNQIEALDLNAEYAVLREQLATCHHTLLPVYEGALDNIVGILHVRRALSLMQHETFTTSELRELLHEPYFIPSDTALLSQLQHFQERQIRLGLVVDEYGELLGLVTLENILEEIVGDFTTQSPAQTGKFQRHEDGSLLVEGATPLRDLNRKLGMRFPLDGAKTLNGLILEHLQDIPEAGTSLKIAGYPIEIIQMQDRVVKVVKVFPALRTTLPQKGSKGA
ncbi:MAG: HlyC/CorC family transporter [Gallionellaceae bacterium]|nr:HlyC/CorC family transporter [Gallionellaceae bacterium]